MRKATLLLLALSALVLSGGPAPASGSGSDKSPGPKPENLSVAVPGGSTVTKCHWEWRKKKRVRWVWRHGRKKRVVTFRKYKVRKCRTIEVPVPDPARLGVKAWEFGFTLSAIEIKAGDTIIELNNQGEDSHDLHVQRVDGDDEIATPETGPGQVNQIRFTTTPGIYRLWCSLPTHAQRGMDTTITVS